MDAYKLFLEKFEDFTDIQKKSFQIIERGENCIITAPTGSGKTEAAILPILNKIANSKEKNGVLAVYITPLRALNRDLLKRLEELCNKLEISISVRHGDTKQSERLKQSKSIPQFLITTPESIQSILLTKNLRASLKNLKFVIVDELHELYYNKRGAQLAVGLCRVEDIAGSFQRIGVSATIGSMDQCAKFLCNDKKYVIIDTGDTKQIDVKVEMPLVPKENYKDFKEVFDLDNESMARIERIAELIKEKNSTLIFGNTRQVVESLGSKLIYFNNLKGFGTIGVHHSSLDKEERIKVENAFKEGKLKSIIATSSLELGIDIGSIDLVIQYGSPRQVTRLLQRIGRAGHTEKRVSLGKIICVSTLDAIEAAETCRAALAKELEERKVEKFALDVLLNQIVGIVLENKNIEKETVYNIIKKSYPYSDLEKPVFDRIIIFGEEHHLLRSKDKFLEQAGRTRKYFIENISVIPDSQRFIVKRILDNKIISSLDEKFVSSYVDEGSSFISKGLAWKVISIEENTIFVESANTVEASIPDWEGEDIPVSYAVASNAYDLLDKNKLEEIERFLDKNSQNKIGELIQDQERYAVPSKTLLVVEELENYILLHVALGKKANEFLSRIIGSILVSTFKENFVVKATPYCVIIEKSEHQSRIDVKKVIEMFKNFDLNAFVKKSEFIKNTELFRYKFVQISKLFGIVEKRAVITKNIANRLIEFYKNSQIFEETLRDLNKNYFDFEIVERVQREIKDGNIKFAFTEGKTPLANQILKSAFFYRELLLPVTPGSGDIETFIERMNSKNAELLCTYCRFRFDRKISELEEKEAIVCRICKSPMISLFREDYREVLDKKAKGKRLDKKEVLLYKDMIKEAGLISAYGKRAIVALETYGVGLSTAGRLLKLLRTDYKTFVIDVINAQKIFIKNKKFWKAK